jgi:uncharacterized protein involved in exopolysaccharide biosynthesis
MNNDEIINKPQQKQRIGFTTLWNAVKKYRKLYYKALGIAFVLALVYSFSLPKVYKCEVMLAPELSTARSSNSLSSLARSFGMRIGTSVLGNGSEALMPTLYPDLMNSVDFKTSLFDVQVCAKDSVKPKSYYDYLLNDQKRPWWSAVIGGVKGAVFGLFAKKDSTDQIKKVNPFRLTKKQTAIAKMIDKKVVCDVDQKTLVITIDVRDQDPVICATVADSVKERLQQFITDYRTNKSRIDLEYNKKLCADSKARYERARQRYVEFADANQDVILQSVRTRLTDLENEMQLQFNAYQTYATQVQNSEAQVQQETPAFMTLQSATVPIKPAGPSKKKYIIIFLFLAFVGTSTYVLFKEHLLMPLLGLS